MKTLAMVVLGLTVCGMLASPTAWAGPYPEKDRAELAKALRGGKVPLEQGLSASAREGNPISGKFELDEGKLQLSVYTAKGGKFSEVIVDYTTGKVSKVEPITSGDDLTAAKAQGAAMAKAKRSLRDAVAQAVKANAGFRAVSIYPSLKDGHPIAEVALVKGDQWRTISEKLD